MKKAFEIIDLLARSEKPRAKGLTMVLDKGLGLHQAEDLMEAAPYIDIIKLGWGTPRLFSEKFIRNKVAFTKNMILPYATAGHFSKLPSSRIKPKHFIIMPVTLVLI